MRAEGEQIIRAVIRDLRETLRKHTDLDRLDPLDAVPEVAMGSRNAAAASRAVDAKGPAEAYCATTERFCG